MRQFIMKITIEISEKDYKIICNTIMTVEELYETVKGRVYRAIINGVNKQLESNDIYEFLKECKKDSYLELAKQDRPITRKEFEALPMDGFTFISYL